MWQGHSWGATGVCLLSLAHSSFNMHRPFCGRMTSVSLTLLFPYRTCVLTEGIIVLVVRVSFPHAFGNLWGLNNSPHLVRLVVLSLNKTVPPVTLSTSMSESPTPRGQDAADDDADKGEDQDTGFQAVTTFTFQSPGEFLPATTRSVPLQDSAALEARACVPWRSSSGSGRYWSAFRP